MYRSGKPTLDQTRLSYGEEGGCGGLNGYKREENNVVIERNRLVIIF